MHRSYDHLSRVRQLSLSFWQTVTRKFDKYLSIIELNQFLNDIVFAGYLIRKVTNSKNLAELYREASHKSQVTTKQQSTNKQCARKR